VVFLVAKEFWKMCRQLAIWYSILALELNVYFGCRPWNYLEDGPSHVIAFIKS
jgi:hypothetical protein